MRSLLRSALWPLAFVAGLAVLARVMSFADGRGASPWLSVSGAIIAGALVFGFIVSVGESRLPRATSDLPVVLGARSATPRCSELAVSIGAVALVAAVVYFVVASRPFG